MIDRSVEGGYEDWLMAGTRPFSGPCPTLLVLSSCVGIDCLAGAPAPAGGSGGGGEGGGEWSIIVRMADGWPLV